MEFQCVMFVTMLDTVLILKFENFQIATSGIIHEITV